MTTLRSQNPTIQKPSAELSFAGAGILGPILAGFGGRLVISLDGDEEVEEIKIVSDGFERVLEWEIAPYSPPQAWAMVRFGEDVPSGTSSVKSYVEWTTDRGTSRRQIWCKNLPTMGALYIDNQEAQKGTPNIFVNLGDSDSQAANATLSFNVLPTFNDEFFTQQEYVGNRFANTVRNWGGAKTVEVFLDGNNIFEEMELHDLHGYYLRSPAYGVHTVVIKLRPEWGSGHTVDINGQFRVRQIPCP